MRKFWNFLCGELSRIIIGAAFFALAIAFEHIPRVAELVWLSLGFYIVALLIAGLPVFIDAVRGILRRDLLDEKFLMSIASVGAFFVGEYSEGVAVMLFFLVGEYFEHKAVGKSRRSIRALMDIRPDEACVIEDGKEITFDADEVEIGTHIVIRAGERVPLDSVIISGSADIDTSAITGESLPRSVTVGDHISSGTVVTNGVLNARTVRMADDSAASRILELVENANERKSRTESFITKFSRVYTPIVVALALIVALIPPLFSLLTWGESVYRALTFLVVSCPCALVISVPMAFFGGIGKAASRGILYKGGNVFSSLANADSFVFDKTGTLTSGEFSVISTVPVGVSEEELLYLSASAEYGSNHPLARCIKGASQKSIVPTETRELAGKGVYAVVEGSEILVGNKSLLSEYSVELCASYDVTGAVFVARDGEFIGSVIIGDTIKKEAASAIRALRKKGVKRTVMLSGDRGDIASSVGKELGLDEIYSELLPEDKYRKLEKLIKENKSTVFVGDGINDAPSIVLADVGVAMGAIGSDSAIEAADVVLMSDDLSRLPEAMSIASKSIRISKQNIVFALGIKGLILILGAVGFANMWLAVFADVGVAALAILNSMRTLR